MADNATKLKVKAYLLQEEAPTLASKNIDVWLYLNVQTCKESVFMIIDKIILDICDLCQHTFDFLVASVKEVSGFIQNIGLGFTRTSDSTVTRLFVVSDSLFSSL
jgi:hypothetical protein